MTAVKIENLKFRYDKENPSYNIDGISFDVHKGEYISLIGHNGSGKSTLSKLIIGLLEAEEGKIEVYGEELNNASIRDVRSKIGIVFQNPDNQLFAPTVEEDVAFGPMNLGLPIEEVEKRVKILIIFLTFLYIEYIILEAGVIL